MQEVSTQHRTAVITPGVSYRGDGTTGVVRPGTERDLVTILETTRRFFAPQSTIVIDGVPLDVLAAQSDKVTAAGWKHAEVTAWTLYRDGNGREVSIGCRAAMLPRVHFGVLFERDTDAGVLAMLLDRYHHVTGHAWRGTCASTALAAIRATWANDRYQPLWSFDVPAPWSGVGPLVWSRELNGWEATWGWVHTFDASGAYLGAGSTAELAWSELTPGGAQPFDHRLPGYWELRLDTGTLASLDHATRFGAPPLFPPRRVRGGCVRVTTPYAKLLQDLGLGFDVLDCLTGAELRRTNGSQVHPAQSRILRKWGERMRDARATAQGWPAASLRAVLDTAVKRTYTDATGAMQRRGKRIYRADWAHTLIDLWRATLYRKMLLIYQTQEIWPVAVKTDSLAYADSSPDPAVLLGALNGSVRGARWRHQQTVTTHAWRAAQPARKGRQR